MLIARRPATRRRGFTLIELIVVMAIIAVLMALTTAAVMKVLVKGPETRARSEIEQLQAAVSETKQKHNVEYIPSRIVLYESIASYGSSKLEVESLIFLKKFFGRTLGENLGPTGFVDWNGNGKADAGAITLSGDQCLVFFLGGIPHPTEPQCLGFSTSDRNPGQPGGSRRGPYYNFQGNRLQRGANGFFSYRDPFDRQVYAYFSNYGQKNGYNRYGSSDCSGIAAYASSGTTYVNPDSFQIICAGPDFTFGPGGLWGLNNPATGPGADDMSNFSPRRLGSP